MAKAVKYSAVAMELKKEYLKEHLDSVEKLIGEWLQKLLVPTPLTPDKGIWSWESVYKPTIEQDPDSNHMLRHHLRSRALWSHHANWSRKLESIWHLTSDVKEEADKKHKEQSLNKQRQYTDDYINTALWQGFEMACGNKLRIAYKTPDDQVGLSFGAYRIEGSVKSADERTLVEKEHHDFIYDIASLELLGALVDTWTEVLKIQQNMQALVTKALKSKDILYSCRFCKHLWK